MQVKEIANRLDVSSATVRNWTREFSQYLTKEAAPPPGKPRQYSQGDLELLAAVAHYKSQGLTYGQIHESLKAGAHLEADIPIPEAPPPKEETSLVPLALLQDYVIQVERLHDRLNDQAQEIGYLKARNEYLESHLQDLQSKQAKTWLDRLLGR